MTEAHIELASSSLSSKAEEGIGTFPVIVDVVGLQEEPTELARIVAVVEVGKHCTVHFWPAAERFGEAVVEVGTYCTVHFWQAAERFGEVVVEDCKAPFLEWEVEAAWERCTLCKLARWVVLLE